MTEPALWNDRGDFLPLSDEQLAELQWPDERVRDYKNLAAAAEASEIAEADVKAKEAAATAAMQNLNEAAARERSKHPRPSRIEEARKYFGPAR